MRQNCFVHDDAILAREIYIKTPSYCFGNRQSNARYWSKMRLIVGLCAGAPFIIRNHPYRENDWASFTGIVEKLMAGYDYPGEGGNKSV